MEITEEQANHPFVYNAQAAACLNFLACDNDIAGTVSNPVMGEVPSCQRCADTTHQTLKPIPSGAVPMIRFTSATELPEPVVSIPSDSEVTYFLANADGTEVGK